MEIILMILEQGMLTRCEHLVDTPRDDFQNSTFTIATLFSQPWHNLSSFFPSTESRVSKSSSDHSRHFPHRYRPTHINLTSHGQTRLAPWLPAGHASCCGRARQSRHSSPPAKVGIKHTHTHHLLAPSPRKANHQ